MTVLEQNRGASEDGFFAGSNGRQIFWRTWLAEKPKAVIVLAHGASEHSGRYGHFAGEMADAGISVYALDHQGHGRSGGDRALLESIDSAVADIDQLVDRAAAANPGLPLFLLGHSMGGALSIEYTLRHQAKLTGLVLSGPLAVLDAAPAPLRLVASILSRFFPTLPLVDIEADGVSSDPAIVEDYVSDPLNHHGKLPVRTVAELSGIVLSFPDRLPTITIPLIVMHGGDDILIPSEAAELVHGKATSEDKEIEIYPGLAHEILNEPSWEEISKRIRDWILQRS